MGAARAPAQGSLKVARLSPRLPGPGIRVHAEQRDTVALGHLPGCPQSCRCHRGAVEPWPLSSLRPGARSTSDLPAGGAGAAGAVPGPVSLLRVVLGPAPAARGSRSRGCGVRRGRVPGRLRTLRGSFGSCHGPGARGGGGRVGPGAAGGGAAGDWAGAGDRVAGAAARPLAMAPRGRASRLPSRCRHRPTRAGPSPPGPASAPPAPPPPPPARLMLPAPGRERLRDPQSAGPLGIPELASRPAREGRWGPHCQRCGPGESAPESSTELGTQEGALGRPCERHQQRVKEPVGVTGDSEILREAFMKITGRRFNATQSHASSLPVVSSNRSQTERTWSRLQPAPKMRRKQTPPDPPSFRAR